MRGLATETDLTLIVLVSTELPIALRCVLLVVFAATTGQMRTLLAGRLIGGRWWMWIAVVV